VTQHDNLTKLATEFQKTKKFDVRINEYTGIDAEKAFIEAQAKVKSPVKKDRVATADELDDYIEILDPTGEAGIVNEGMTVKALDKMVAEQKAYMADMQSQYKSGALDKYVKPEVLEEQKLFRQKKIDKVLDKAYDEVFYQKPATGDHKYDADVLAESIAEQLGKVFDDLPQTHQTQIYNTALNRIQQIQKMVLGKPTKTTAEKLLKTEDFVEIDLMAFKKTLPSELIDKLNKLPVENQTVLLKQFKEAFDATKKGGVEGGINVLEKQLLEDFIPKGRPHATGGLIDGYATGGVSNLFRSR